MRAAVLHAPGDLRIEDRPAPAVSGADEVLIQVHYNGLCGTDATEFAKGPMMVPLQTPHPGSKHVGPTILGHEFVGEVLDAGASARHLIGQRVACGAGVSCGTCAWCRAGRTNLCAHYYTLGLSTHGGLAELVAAPSGICAVIDAGIDMQDAALAQPLAVGIHSVRRAAVASGDTIVVLGVGAIGSFICAALADHDGDVIAIDIDQTRLEVGRSLGANRAELIAPDASTVELLELLPGGAQVVFETSGVVGSADRAFGLAARGGRVVLVGLTKSPQPLVLSDLVLREVDVTTTVAHVCGTDIPDALALLASRPLSRLLPTQVIGLDAVVGEGLEPLVAGRARGKILVDPRG